jgi:hypothetical protein
MVIMAITFKTQKLIKNIELMKAQYSDLMAQAYEYGVNGDGSAASHTEADKCRAMAQGIRSVWIQLEHDFDLEGSEIDVTEMVQKNKDLSTMYIEWLQTSKELNDSGEFHSIDCGEASVRLDFSNFAGLKKIITFDSMHELEKAYS